MVGVVLPHVGGIASVVGDLIQCVELKPAGQFAGGTGGGQGEPEGGERVLVAGLGGVDVAWHACSPGESVEGGQHRL